MSGLSAIAELLVYLCGYASFISDKAVSYNDSALLATNPEPYITRKLPENVAIYLLLWNGKNGKIYDFLLIF